MTLWNIYSLIEFICNKNFNGNIITPKKFAELIPIVQLDWFRHKYGLPEEYQPGKPIPREYVEITLKNTDDMKAFKVFLPNVPVVEGKVDYPSDYCHLDTLYYNFVIKINKVDETLPRSIEILRESQLASRLGNYTKRPTLRMPCGIMRQNGIYIYPSQVSALNPVAITSLDFTYFRYPRDPVFAYNQMAGYITYNAAASTELEAPADEYIVIARMLLQYIGLNLREQEISNYSELKLKEG